MSQASQRVNTWKYAKLVSFLKTTWLYWDNFIKDSFSTSSLLL